MAFSPTDPASAHSLWLQLRTTKRTRRRRWRSDWTPLFVVLLFFSLLLIFYAIMPSNDAPEQANPTRDRPPRAFDEDLSSTVSERLMFA
jgi:NADH:ubiquinone oxidoreductase subunit 6 (subunit J)